MGAHEYDVIGDVHGCGPKLVGLLERLGWRRDAGGWRPPHDGRQAVFVGDLIDRGDDHLAVLTTVRAMVDAGHARIVMGNHELNAMGFATEHPDEPGRHLRERSAKNLRQHRAFLDQLDDGERAEWIGWFATLPLWLDLGDLRVVHACWHGASIDLLERAFGGDRFPTGAAGLDALVRANTHGDPIWRAIEVVLKGPEVALADYGLPPYLDKDGTPRAHARARWWHAGATVIGDLVDIPAGATTEDGGPYPELPLIPCAPADRTFTYDDDIPVVYGHHWRRWEPDEHLDWTSTTACVDFSAVRGGPLVAYAWRGERRIDPARYVRSP